MKPYIIFLAACLIITILAAGCTTTPPSGGTPVPTTTGTPPVTTVATTIPATRVATSPTVPPVSPIQGTWYLQELLYQDAPAPLTVQDVRITATFDNAGIVSGYSGCNNYEARYTLTAQSTATGNGLVIGPVSKSNMFCSATRDLENSYLAILGSATGYDLYPNNILMINDNQGNSLSFAATPYSSPGSSIPSF